VNPVSGVGGFVYPGDRVDVMLTHTLYSKKTIERTKNEALDEALAEIEDLQGQKKKPEQNELQDRLKLINAKIQIANQREKEADPVTEVIVSDVRVLAVNQKAVLSSEDNGKKEIPQTVTLEVLKEDAQRVKLAEREGQLSLALRSLHDKSAAIENPSADGDLSRTIPPGYFPKLYEFDSEYPKELLVKKKPKRYDHNKKENTVTIVRGVKVQEMEFEKPEGAQ
jgi:hypothetical protein